VQLGERRESARGALGRGARGHVAIDEQLHARQRAHVLEHEREARAALRRSVDARHADRHAVRERAAEGALERPEAERVREHARRERAARQLHVRICGQIRRRAARELELDQEVLAVAALEHDAGQAHARDRRQRRDAIGRSRAQERVDDVFARERLGRRGQRAAERRVDAVGRDPTRRRGDLPTERERTRHGAVLKRSRARRR